MTRIPDERQFVVLGAEFLRGAAGLTMVFRRDDSALAFSSLNVRVRLIPESYEDTAPDVLSRGEAVAPHL